MSWTHRLVGAAVAASVVLGAVPHAAWADGRSVSGAGRSVDLRAAIDRAGTDIAADRHQPSPAAARTRAARTAAQMGGGGGKGVLIWTIVGTAISAAATYFIIKETRRQTDEARRE